MKDKIGFHWIDEPRWSYFPLLLPLLFLLLSANLPSLARSVDFTYRPTTPQVGEPVKLTASISSDPWAECNYNWSFFTHENVPSPSNKQGKSVAVTFSKPATYWIQLKVEYQSGKNIGSLQRSIEVKKNSSKKTSSDPPVESGKKESNATITVAKDGSSDYSSIQDAVDGANVGDTVYVKAGIYHETIELKSGITLRGAGRERTKIKFGGDACVIDATGVSNVKVRNFTIEYTGSNGHATLWIDHSSKDVTVSENVITGATYAGIEIDGDSTDILIESNTVRDNTQSGIYIHDNSKGTVKNNEIYDNKYGIEISTGSSPLVENNIIYKNAKHGILIHEKSPGKVIGNEIYDNEGDGINVEEESNPLISKNLIRGNENHGVGIETKATGEILENEILLNRYSGIKINGRNTRPIVHNNTIALNKQNGVFVHSNAEPVIKNNIVAKNEDGIDVTFQDHPDGNPTVSYNDVWGNDQNYEGMDQPSTDFAKDPQFIDLTTHKLRLRHSSPCIGAGEDGVDLGAHQYKDSGPASLKVKVTGQSGENLDAKIYLDGSYEGNTGWDGEYILGDLSSGNHSIKAKEKGYNSASVSVNLSSGEREEITLALKEEKELPKALFTFSPEDPTMGEKILFNSSKSKDPDGDIKEYEWSFGDGDSSSTKNPSHSYKDDGTYRVKLTVTDDEGRTSSTTKRVRVENRAPEATFTFSPQRPAAGQEVMFDACGSSDKDGSIRKYSWDLNGNGYYERFLEDCKEKHVFKSPGEYEVRLKVTDNDHSKAETKRLITVVEANEPPQSSFTYSPSRPTDLEKVGFESTATDPDGSIERYSWSFGDGGGSAKANPAYKYADDGIYEIKLTVTDNEGAKATVSKEITVENVGPSAQLNHTPAKPVVDQEVTFDASKSTDPDGKVEEYRWDLNGDGSNDRKGAEITWTYDRAKKYKVLLTVVDGDGATSSTVQKVQVLEEGGEQEGEGQQQTAKIEDKYALVVGITTYKHSILNNLEFPAKDAKDFAGLLLDDTVGGFKEENVITLTNKEATTGRMDDALKELVTRVSEEDLVVIYYSGHGTWGPDPDGDEEDGQDEYYVTYDTDPTSRKSIYRTALSDDQFSARVKSLPSKQVVIFLDSCYSGGQTKGAGRKGFAVGGQKSPSDPTVFSDFADFEETVLFAASQEDQRSWEPPPELRDRMENGVFTHYLLEGLKGAADVNEDGTITIRELREYLRPNVEEFVQENFINARQVPFFKGGVPSTLPLIEGRVKLEGEVAYLQEGAGERASQEEYVVIDLGRADGVHKGDLFDLFYTPAKDVIIEGLKAKIEVEEVIGPHLSSCKVGETDFGIKRGYKVRKVKDSDKQIE